MWYPLRMLSRSSPADLSALADLVQAVARTMLVVTCLFCGIAVILLAGNAATYLMGSLLVVTMLLVLFFILAYRLLEYWYLAAQILWQLALIAGIVAVMRLLGQPEIILLVALMPLIAGITIGWPASLVAELILIGVTWWATYHVTPALPAEYGLLVIGTGGLAGLLGVAAIHKLLAVVKWCLHSYCEASKRLQEAREQQLVLRQTQDDLLQVNRELARLSDRLKTMNRLVEEARQAKAEFVANVSHEFRTPLNMIIGFAELISQAPQIYGSRLPPALLMDIGAIRRNSQHLATLVNDVLDMSQVDAGRMALSRGWSSLPAIVNAATEVVKSLFETKGLYLTTELPPALPPLYCDETRIRQVIINLLSNAGRFTQAGGVRIQCRHQNSELIVSISDTGPGICEQDQKRVFEPFHQTDSSIRRRHEGSGLGLTISKQFVEMHGGKMWLESQIDRGTTIYFSLPVELPLPKVAGGNGAGFQRSFSPDDPIGYRLRTRPSLAPAPDVTQRFVILEKEKTLERLLARYLPAVEIISTDETARALHELNRSPAQALLLNISPFEKAPAELLTNLPYGTPVMTCWVPGQLEAARQLGVVRYLVKPLTGETLLAALRRLGEDVRSVLVVDDEPDELHLFARMLASDRRGYQILQVTNGQRALSMLRDRRPDVMLLDLIMPGLDGFQVLEEKGRDPAIRDIPVIVISSKDPSGEPLVSNTLTVIHGNGLTVSNLIECIQAISRILLPSSANAEHSLPREY